MEVDLLLTLIFYSICLAISLFLSISTWILFTPKTDKDVDIRNLFEPFNISVDTYSKWLLEKSKKETEMEKKGDYNYTQLWRVENTWYDLNDFIPKHPGGPDWLECTRGSDVTLAFHTHHFNMEMVRSILEKHKVCDVDPQTSLLPITFNEDGFFQTLKREVMKEFKGDFGPSNKMKLITVAFPTLWIFFFILSAVYSSYFFFFHYLWIFVHCSVGIRA